MIPGTVRCRFRIWLLCSIQPLLDAADLGIMLFRRSKVIPVVASDVQLEIHA
jgi:hypothetical protein